MGDVKQSLREINGKLFDKAFQDDPQIACQAIGKLVVTLSVATRQLGTTEYDARLNRARMGANAAWAQLTRDKEPGRAMQTVRAVLTDDLGDMAFDIRITTLEPNAFMGMK